MGYLQAESGQLDVVRSSEMFGTWLRVEKWLTVQSKELRNAPKMAGWELRDGQLRAETGQVNVVRIDEMSGY